MNDVLLDILYIIITGCGVVVAKYIVSLINKKINEAQTKIESSEYEKLNKYVDLAQDVIEKAVLSTAQTYVDSLKNANNFTKEAQEEAKNKAIEIAKQMITEESKEAIILLYGDFNVYLDSTLESLVKQNKSSK